MKNWFLFSNLKAVLSCKIIETKNSSNSGRIVSAIKENEKVIESSVPSGITADVDISKITVKGRFAFYIIACFCDSNKVKVKYSYLINFFKSIYLEITIVKTEDENVLDFGYSLSCTFKNDIQICSNQSIKLTDDGDYEYYGDLIYFTDEFYDYETLQTVEQELAQEMSSQETGEISTSNSSSISNLTSTIDFLICF